MSLGVRLRRDSSKSSRWFSHVRELVYFGRRQHPTVAHDISLCGVSDCDITRNYTITQYDMCAFRRSMSDTELDYRETPVLVSFLRVR